MSKINAGLMSSSIETMLQESKDSKRNFKESIDLQITLKNYDPQKDKRFSGSMRLPKIARPRFSVCIIGDQFHCDQAQKANVPNKNVDDLKKLNKNKKLVKKMCQEFNVFLASETLIKQIPRIVGPFMNRAGKFPAPILQSDSIKEKVDEVRSMVKFQLKKTLALGVCIGHAEMSQEDVRVNLTIAVNFLVSLLKKGWQNIRTVNVKSSMGKSKRLY
jgi:large subunit ribosomal protein L10Ae